MQITAGHLLVYLVYKQAENLTLPGSLAFIDYVKGIGYVLCIC